MKNKIFDRDGNELCIGDTVELHFVINEESKCGVGKIWTIADMNDKQTNMPYIEGRGAWQPMGLRKLSNT